jgi:hypothetical protein
MIERGMNQSQVSDDRWCKTSYFIDYILRVKKTSDDLIRGTNVHNLLYRFYDFVDFKKLIKMDLNYIDLRDYIYDVIIDIAPEKDFDGTAAVRNFAELESTRVINLRKESKMKKLYYYPLYREYAMEMPLSFMGLEDLENEYDNIFYGTPDVIYWMHPKYTYNGKRYKYILADYKTGKVRSELKTSNRWQLTGYIDLMCYIFGVKREDVLGILIQLGDEVKNCNKNTKHKKISKLENGMYYCADCDEEFYPHRILEYEYKNISKTYFYRYIDSLRRERHIKDPEYWTPQRYGGKCMWCSNKDLCEELFKTDDDFQLYYDYDFADLLPRREDK